MDWASHYPAFIETETANHRHEETPNVPSTALKKEVTIADIGCGFGGLLVALAPKFPDELIIGMCTYERNQGIR